MESEEYVARILPLQLRRGTRRGREDVTGGEEEGHQGVRVNGVTMLDIPRGGLSDLIKGAYCPADEWNNKVSYGYNKGTRGFMGN